MKHLVRVIGDVLDDAVLVACAACAVYVGIPMAVEGCRLWSLGDTPMGLWPEQSGWVGIATATAGVFVLEVVVRRRVRRYRRARRMEATP